MHQIKRPRQIPIGEDGSDPTARPTQLPVRQLAAEGDTTTKNVLTKSISKPLKRQIIALIARHRSELAHPDLASDHNFPTLPGSHLNLKNTHPVLQLVRSIMHVFSLDKSINLEARYLRKELLAFFEIKEFSAQARFENPSSSLKLEQLICEHCTMARDLDLCRDEDVLPETATKDSEPVARAWACTTCGQQYDRLAIEERLIGRVQKVLVEWQTQDLKCGKCKSIRVNDFMEHCGCSGVWVGTVNREDVVGKLRVLERVSKAYKLRMLEGVMEDVLARL